MAGVKESDGKMMNEQEFKEKWEEVHQKTREDIKKKYFDVKYKEKAE